MTEAEEGKRARLNPPDRQYWRFVPTHYGEHAGYIQAIQVDRKTAKHRTIAIVAWVQAVPEQPSGAETLNGMLMAAGLNLHLACEDAEKLILEAVDLIIHDGAKRRLRQALGAIQTALAHAATPANREGQ